MEIIKDLGTRRYSGKMKRFLLVKCPSCSKEFETLGYNLTKKNPMKMCRSCSSTIGATKHGFHGTDIYNKWQSMNARVGAKNGKNYRSYGEKGIKVCEEWKDFMVFKEWAENNGYRENLELDRRENNGDYTPLNCRWVTRAVQTQNNRPLRSSNTSGYRGVSKVRSNRFVARCHLDLKRVNIGTYDTLELAAVAYDLFVSENNLEHPLNILIMKDLGMSKEQVIDLLKDICEYRGTEFEYIMKRTGMMNQILKEYRI